MEPLFSHLNHWHWWIFAVILLVLEILTPGTFFMWMGISAVVVGLLMLIVPIGWETQFLLFAIFSVVSIAVGRVYIKRRPIETDRPNLNRRGAQYVGRTFTLSEPIVHGFALRTRRSLSGSAGTAGRSRTPVGLRTMAFCRASVGRKTTT